MSILLDVIERSTRLGDKTKSAYHLCVSRFIEFASNDPQVWDGATVEAWREHLVLRGLSAVTVNKHLYALRYASGRLEGLGAGRDFARAAESLPTPKQIGRQALSLEEVQALMFTCERARPMDLRDRMIMTIALRTGLRASNLVGMSWGSINGRIAECTIKGQKEHRVILDDSCIAAIESWAGWLSRTGNPRGGIVWSVREHLDGSYRKGHEIRRRQWVNEMLSARATEAGIRKILPHLFRHTFVSWALEAGVPPHRVMRQTGHANMATMSRYVTDLEAESNPIGNHLPEF